MYLKSFLPYLHHASDRLHYDTWILCGVRGEGIGVTVSQEQNKKQTQIGGVCIKIALEDVLTGGLRIAPWGRQD